MGMFDSGMFNIGANKYDNQTDWNGISDYYKGNNKKPSEMFSDAPPDKGQAFTMPETAPNGLRETVGVPPSLPKRSNGGVPSEILQQMQHEYNPDALTTDMWNAIRDSKNQYDNYAEMVAAMADKFDPAQSGNFKNYQAAVNEYQNIKGQLPAIGNKYDTAVQGLKGLADMYDDPAQEAELRRALAELQMEKGELSNAYDEQAAGLGNLADLYQNNARVGQIDELIDDSYNFDKDRYRAQAQAQIQTNANDLANATLGKLMNTGQLNSSAGQNYFSGTQAKYLMPTLSALEDKIQQYGMDYADRKLGAIKEADSLENRDKNAYAELMAKKYGISVDKAKSMLTVDQYNAEKQYQGAQDVIALQNDQKDKVADKLSKAWGLDIDGAQKLIDLATDLTGEQVAGYNNILNTESKMNTTYSDMIKDALGIKSEGSRNLIADLGALMQGEINWDTFRANYTTGDGPITPGGDGPTWGDKQLTAEDFSEVGTAIENVFHDKYGLPWDEQIDQGDGYSVMKSAVGDNKFKLTYYKDGRKMFDYTFNKDADYGEVARALWGKFDDGMKDNWGTDFKWGNSASVTTEITNDGTGEGSSYDAWLSSLVNEHGGISDTSPKDVLGVPYTRYTFADGYIKTVPTANVGKEIQGESKDGWDEAGAIADKFREHGNWVDGKAEGADGKEHDIKFGLFQGWPALYIDGQLEWSADDRYPTLDSYRVGMGFRIAKALGVEI